MQIYLDNAATTYPIPFTYDGLLANPSSPHAAGIEAERKLSHARKEIAKYLQSDLHDIIFTSGGTESNNIALLGFAIANRRKGTDTITFLAEPWEHPSILEPLKHIKETGLASVHISPHDQWHSINSPTPSVCLVAISLVNNETGDINPIAAIAEKLKAKNPHTIILLDAVQGFGKENIPLFHVDILTFSAHKFHGPAGVGGLVRRPGIRLTPLMYGGSQENKLRPGTENVHGVLHMVEALQRSSDACNVAAIKHTLAEIAIELPDVLINTRAALQDINPASPRCMSEQLDIRAKSEYFITSSFEDTSSYILNMSFLGVKSEPLVHLLSEKGIFVSMGAACRSKKNTKSPLELMGFSKERADSAVRFSFSNLNTIEEAHAAKAVIIECVTWMRKHSHIS